MKTVKCFFIIPAILQITVSLFGNHQPVFHADVFQKAFPNDENGEMLINEETFLSKYGNGTDTECVLPFYNLTMADAEGSYGIEYAGEIYIVDRNLSLLRKVAKKSLPNEFIFIVFIQQVRIVFPVSFNTINQRSVLHCKFSIVIAVIQGLSGNSIITRIEIAVVVYLKYI